MKKFKILALILTLIGMVYATSVINKNNNSRTDMMDNLDDGTVKAPATGEN